MYPVIICGGSTGRAVVYGYVDEIPEAEQIVTVHNARMVLCWPAECGGLFGLAANGPKDGLRLTAPVAIVSDTARQVLSVTDAAACAIDKWQSV